MHSVQSYPHQGTEQQLNGDTNTVSIEFTNPVDFNLIVMANGTTLRRVRDSRGRATGSNSTLDNLTVTDANGKSQIVSRSRGLLEADLNDPDTWIAVSQRKILLRLSAKLAGTGQFPDIRFVVPGEGQLSLPIVLDYRTYGATLTAGTKTYFACHPKLSEYIAPLPREDRNQNDGCMPQPLSMWYPLFSHVAETNHRLSVTRVQTSNMDAPDNSYNDRQLGVTTPRPQDSQQYYFLRVDDGASILDANALVTISSPGHKRLANPIALECAPLEGRLLCHTHVQTIVFGSGHGTSQWCLATDFTRPGILFYRPVLDSCGWENYRLQFEVFQPGTISGQEPLITSLPLPSFTTRPGIVVGNAPILQKSTSGWDIQYPVYYPVLATLPKNVCFGTSVDSRVDARITALDGTGPVERGAVLRATLPQYPPLLAMKNVVIWDGPCAAKSSNILGTVPGLARKSFGQLTVTKFGDNKSVYQFTGSGLEGIDRVMTYQDGGYKGERAADVVTVDANTILVNVSGLDANGKNAFLYFGIGPSRIPVIGCVTKPGKVTPKKDAIPEVLGKEEVRGKRNTHKTCSARSSRIEGPRYCHMWTIILATTPEATPGKGKGGKKKPTRNKTV